ncbi:uncharacterized protein EI90DRAFT_3053599 [Cantharellus anzutake]|uniref:uncharacterized protein n=1 Tax=Cantharellus anzutake TaxID=1750568 RepID=UPI0019055061|nr:uncharacterized protein EI90DRAFT_3053599 [Cantharellus anzutake]KAF8333256.1 hypothetical protein EI90DRAFT_3053599 [Cantharellus anzutake]
MLKLHQREAFIEFQSERTFTIVDPYGLIYKVGALDHFVPVRRLRLPVEHDFLLVLHTGWANCVTFSTVLSTFPVSTAFISRYKYIPPVFGRRHGLEQKQSFLWSIPNYTIYRSSMIGTWNWTSVASTIVPPWLCSLLGCRFGGTRGACPLRLGSSYIEMRGWFRQISFYWFKSCWEPPIFFRAHSWVRGTNVSSQP